MCFDLSVTCILMRFFRSWFLDYWRILVFYYICGGVMLPYGVKECLGLWDCVGANRL